VADARDIALDVLRRVFTQRAFASTALRHELGRRPTSGPDRGLATEIVYGVLRRRAHLDAAISHCSGRRFKDIDPRAHDILRVAAYQLMLLDRVPDFAAVDTAVRQAKRRRVHAGFVNAVLRKLAACPPDQRLPPGPGPSADPVARVAWEAGLPQLLARQLVDDLGVDEALAFGRASLDPAPLTLRANRRRTTVEALAAEVGGAPGARPFSVRLPAGGHQLPADLPCVVEGRASPQDEAAMQVVEMLDPQPDDRVLDVCSAPGGKTTHMAECMDDRGEVWAYDRLPTRLDRVRANADRLGLSCVRPVEVLPPAEPTFDRVLVDAPCSGLGTLRRHPELRWKFDPRDLPALHRTQAEVLREGARRVRPGGLLVYSVCTVTQAEGPLAVEPLTDTFAVEDTLLTGPHQSGAPDGFFAARLRKRP
jgi:16S rRNA (cytosine967-C5)-methyltransferase